MDKNQTIGIVLITLLFVVYFTFFAPQPIPPQNISKDTTAKTLVKKDTTAKKVDSQAIDSTYAQKFGSFASAALGNEEKVILKNDDIELTFTNKGAYIEQVMLRNHLTWDKKPLYLFTASSRQEHFYLPLPTGMIDTRALFFEKTAESKIADSTLLEYTLQVADGKQIIHTFIIPPKGFTVKHSFRLKGFDDSGFTKDLQWQIQEEVLHNEMDKAQMRTSSTVNWYSANGDFNNLSETTTELSTESINSALKWVSFKQKFFNSGIISDQALITSAKVSSVSNVNDTAHIKTLTADLTLSVAAALKNGIQLRYYFGPNKFKILDAVAPGYERNVYLGWPVISWVNKYLVVNVFAFFESYIANYGIIIILLVLLVKLILFPLSYKSYISMAKMKVLKPELDEIKARVGEENLQAIQQEQMKLYSQVGINPLSGCIPLLLQMPVLLAMFNFFPNAIELRQQAFLWASDLSTYDSVLNLPFSIPAYGNHVSLFTISMTISTLVWTWYNNQTSTVTGPMQSVSYIMPVVFMFILNSLPAGLSFYYFVSNVVSIVQQQIIKRFVDEDKLHKKLQENKVKNANKKKTGFAARLEEAMRTAAEEQKKQQQQKDKKRR
jgi:YidC/Oxa1 family membrane protein insertase